jgi:hypothetical protein
MQATCSGYTLATANEHERTLRSALWLRLMLPMLPLMMLLLMLLLLLSRTATSCGGCIRCGCDGGVCCFCGRVSLKTSLQLVPTAAVAVEALGTPLMRADVVVTSLTVGGTLAVLLSAVAKGARLRCCVVNV